MSTIELTPRWISVPDLVAPLQPAVETPRFRRWAEAPADSRSRCVSGSSRSGRSSTRR